MPRSQAELEAAREEDLRRILESEALLILLLNRSTKVDSNLSAAKRAQKVFERAKIAGSLGWGHAVESSYLATVGQIDDAIGIDVGFDASEVAAELDGLAEATIDQAAHSLASSYLAAEIDGQAVDLGRKVATVSSVLSVTAFGRAREAVVEKLPKRYREVLWVRRDTAGDRRVCPECEQMEGMTAPASVGLDPKAPLHPNCRCSDTIISQTEAEAQPEPRARPDAIEIPSEKPVVLRPRTRQGSGGGGGRGTSPGRGTGGRRGGSGTGGGAGRRTTPASATERRRAKREVGELNIGLRLERKLFADTAMEQLRKYRLAKKTRLVGMLERAMGREWIR